MRAIGIQPDEVEKLLPFHVAFNRALEIVQVGHAWGRLEPGVSVGALLYDVFRLVRPELTLSVQTVEENLDVLVVVECLPKGVLLRGQFTALSDSDLLFVGSPWVKETAELSKLGLYINDWPPYDATREFLFLLRAKEEALEQVRGFSLRLAEQRDQLQKNLDDLNRAIEQRSALERRNGLMIDGSLDAVITMDASGAVTSWNPQAELVFGWQRHDAIGRRVHELIIPVAAREAHCRALSKYLATGRSSRLGRRIEVNACDRAGRELPVELTITPIREGESVLFSAFIRDLSSTKRDQALLAAQFEITKLFSCDIEYQDVAKRTLEIVGDLLSWDLGAIWIVDAKHDELHCLEVWSRAGVVGQEFLESTRKLTLGRGVGLPGRTLANRHSVWIERLELDPTFLRTSSAVSAGIASGVALPILLGDDVWGTIEFFSRERRRRDDEVLRALASVTAQIGQYFEKLRAAKAQRESEAGIRAVVEHMLEGLVIVGPTLEIIQANKSFAEIFGYAREEMTGMPIQKLIPLTEDNQDPRKLADLYIASRDGITEREGRRKTGEAFPIEMQVYEVSTPGGDLIAGSVRDLSREREAGRVKKEFLASVSHELRTPLTAIRGSLGLLSSGKLGKLPEQAQEIVTVADRNAIRLVSLIGDILDFEKSQAGRLSLHRALISLDRTIQRSVESTQTLAQQSSIRICVPSTYLSIYADEVRMSQVLVNLLTNAIKFSPPNEVIEIEAAESADRSLVTVLVHDRGRGIPEKHREIIFEPFRQIEQSDARHYGGVGLGLAICRAIVRQHGGDIGVHARDGGGSTFWFTVPSAAALASAPPPKVEW